MGYGTAGSGRRHGGGGEGAGAEAAPGSGTEHGARDCASKQEGA